jgi:peptide-methionine (R)-S-oxide reductase
MPGARAASITRRDWLVRAAAGAAGLLVSSRMVAVRAQSILDATADDVLIAQFSDAGVRLGVVRLPKVVKSETEWEKQLTPLAFEVARHGETEMPFTGAYWNLHEKGLFRCICCDTALFSSAHKFDSGTGWPSFWQPIATENIAGPKSRHGRSPAETEVKCKRCDAHLGDMFDDGPPPTGWRYCIDSASLRFVKSG